MRERGRTVAMGGGNRKPDPTVGASDPRRRLEDAYRSFGAELWHAVYAFTGGLRHVTDEAVAEAFAQAGLGIDRIERLRPWLYRAAFRIAAGELKRRRRDAVLDPRHDRGVLDDAALGSELAGLLGRLSPNQRGAIFLRGLYGY